MKFNESLNERQQLAAAPLHEGAQSHARVNSEARLNKLSSHQGLSGIALAFQPLPVQDEIAYSAGCQMHDRILRLPDVLHIVGIGRTTLYEMMKAGTFPAPLHLSVRTRGWRLSAIEAFLASKEAE
jgi:predicted DNA-binding transcriptional regulator AlpA